MCAEWNVSRVLHHEREQISKNQILERVQIGVIKPDCSGACDIALGIGVEHVLKLFLGHFTHRFQTDERT